MKRYIERFILLFSVIFICSCSSKPAVLLPPEWGYAKDAIQLHLKSDPQLNLYQGSSHTLLVCTYHLRDPVNGKVKVYQFRELKSVPPIPLAVVI